MNKILIAFLFVVLLCDEGYSQQVVPFVTYVPRPVVVQVPVQVMGYQPVVNYIVVPPPQVVYQAPPVIVQEKRCWFHPQRTVVYPSPNPYFDMRIGSY